MSQAKAISAAIWLAILRMRVGSWTRLEKIEPPPRRLLRDLRGSRSLGGAGDGRGRCRSSEGLFAKVKAALHAALHIRIVFGSDLGAFARELSCRRTLISSTVVEADFDEVGFRVGGEFEGAPTR